LRVGIDRPGWNVPAYEQPPIQREVVFPNGKYVLEGDGVTQAYQWVWIQAIAAVVPAIPPG